VLFELVVVFVFDDDVLTDTELAVVVVKVDARDVVVAAVLIFDVIDETVVGVFEFVVVDVCPLFDVDDGFCWVVVVTETVLAVDEIVDDDDDVFVVVDGLEKVVDVIVEMIVCCVVVDEMSVVVVLALVVNVTVIFSLDVDDFREEVVFSFDVDDIELVVIMLDVLVVNDPVEAVVVKTVDAVVIVDLNEAVDDVGTDIEVVVLDV
jgi:hypothetical protein